MKRFMVVLLVAVLLCGCSMRELLSTKEFTYNHRIIEAVYRSDVAYPKIQILRSYKELETYSSSLINDIKGFQQRDRALEEALKGYDREYFRKNILIIITISASSGGDQFALNSITNADNGLSIEIQKTQKGMTCDMAAWHILIELDKLYDTDIENIHLNLT